MRDDFGNVSRKRRTPTTGKWICSRGKRIHRNGNALTVLDEVRRKNLNREKTAGVPIRKRWGNQQGVSRRGDGGGG